MQFITNGPDIPNILLQAHEEGRATFFCGAGISYPAGLKGFKWLVDEIYRCTGANVDDKAMEKEAYRQEQYDTTLGLLERRLPGRRRAVRNVLPKVLKPNLDRQGATDTHKALLQLARNREGALRLVTTNFDRIFEWVAKKTELSINSHVAPTLPIPKNSRWNGLVYLHGLLPDKPDESALNQLVLTSGDFGLAYLNERWAARFVSELFRNYVVCFVGYSINDPILRYMMDALAADRMLGEDTPPAYVLADYKPGEDDKRAKAIEWEAKGVTPILYESVHGEHSALHRTLKKWAETYRNGKLGKEHIVLEYARSHPSDSTQQDDFVGRMLWALSDKSGLPAKQFADFNPVPTLAWLNAFSADHYGRHDLTRFGVPLYAEVDDKFRFSLVHRPAPYTHTPWMTLVSRGTVDSQWDKVMRNLARWLIRHLNDPKLIIWLGQGGGQLHNKLTDLIDSKLDQLADLEQENKAAELKEIRTTSPNAIPNPSMRTLWNLLLAGRVKSPKQGLGLYRWKDRLKREGPTTTLRLELRELLAPKIELEEPYPYSKEPINIKLVLAADNVYPDNVHYWTSEWNKDERWREALPVLLDDFQQLLRDALDLLHELGQADDHSDLSYWSLPSISPHFQNRGFYGWVALIDLLRDAWLAVKKNDPQRATEIAQGWFDVPYPTFKRLALFAASQKNCIAPDQWLEWLITDDSRWLWSDGTKRETMRLLVLQGVNLSPGIQDRLEARILAGPSCIRGSDNVDTDRQKIWLRLAKLREGSGKLGDAAEKRFDELSAAEPRWKLSNYERDEFSYWIVGTGDPGYEDNREIDIMPRKWRELVKWFRQPDRRSFTFYEDTQRKTYRDRFFHSCRALCNLAKDGIWPAIRWREALQAWSEENEVLLRSWRFAAPLVQTMPDKTLQETSHSVAYWLNRVSRLVKQHEEIVILDLCRRILALSYPNNQNTDDPVTQAINHPVGFVTEALQNRWFERKPNDNDGLPKDIKKFFTSLGDVRERKFRHGRVLLASKLISLFRVDRTWTEEYLLPLFTWETNEKEAKAVWEGFLWSPHLYPPLLLAFKTQFLKTAHHYKKLSKHSGQYARFLTYAALNRTDGYELQDYRDAIASLPQEGLEKSAQTLSQALEGAGEQGEQRENYWKNRIRPFLKDLWPQSRDRVSPDITNSFALMSIAARGEFPAALDSVLGWLRPIENLHYVADKLNESKLAKRFPVDVLAFLGAMIDYRSDSQRWPPYEDIRKCLKDVISADKSLVEDPQYKGLDEYCRIYNH